MKYQKYPNHKGLGSVLIVIGSIIAALILSSFNSDYGNSENASSVEERSE